MADIKKDSQTIAIITEADEIVATGHLKESIDLASELRKRGVRTRLLVNEDIDTDLRKNISMEHDTYFRGDSADLIKKIADSSVIVTDLRRVSNEWIRKIKAAVDAPMICIDELGGRFLGADIIINPMINTKYADYGKTSGIVHAGGQFLILSDKIQSYRSKYIVREEMENICISMGGVDICNSTNKILNTLLRCDDDWHMDVVLGGGYQHVDLIADLVKGRKNIHVHSNIGYIYDLFIKSDMVFSAGGNTLHELACIGVPTVVIPTMEHENENGKTFEDFGFGKCLSKSAKISSEEIMEAVYMMKDLKARKKMSNCGRNICDGKGLERTVRIIFDTMLRK